MQRYCADIPGQRAAREQGLPVLLPLLLLVVLYVHVLLHVEQEMRLFLPLCQGEEDHGEEGDD